MPSTCSSAAIEDVWRLTASSVDRLVALVQELEAAGGPAAVRWQPPVEDGNAVIALAHHTLENLEDNIVYTLPERPRDGRRERGAEFAVADGSSERLVARWADLRARAEATLEPLPSSILRARRVHPRRGDQSVLTLLVVVARHCAEHLAHAELTRDLEARSRRPERQDAPRT